MSWTREKNLIQIKFKEKQMNKNQTNKNPIQTNKNHHHHVEIKCVQVKGDIKAVTRQNDMGIDAENMKGRAFRFHF